MTEDSQPTPCEQYHSFFLRARVPMLLIDPADGRIAEANSAAAQFYGYSVPALQGMQITDINTLPPEQTAQEMARAQGEQRDHFFFQHRLSSGEIRDVEVHSGPFELDGRQLLYSIVHDITERRKAEALLREGEERFRSTFELVAVGLAHVSLDGRFILVNEKYCSLTGYTREEMLARTFLDITHPADHDENLRRVAQLLQGKLSMLVWEKRYVRKDGTLLWGRLTGSVRRNASGEPVHFIVAVEDISEEKRIEQQLRLTSSVFEEAREGIVITDPHASIIRVNRAFSALTGYEGDEVIGKNPNMLQSGHQGRDFYEGMWHSLHEAGFWHGEVWNRRKSGEVYAEDLSITSVHDAQGNLTHYVGMFSDITEKKRQHERIEHLAYHDALTRLPNRTLLSDRMKQALARAARNNTRVAVCYMDLDGFKAVNDAHGHRAGDRLLTQVARRLEASVRAEDTVARLGGDEFVVLLTDLTQEMEEVAVLPRILEKLSEPCTIDEGKTASVSASIGVAVFPGDGGDADTLIRQADQAMYQAKQGGRNRVHLFDAQKDSEARSHRETIARVRSALTGGEFLLHFQPRVNMRSGTVVGAEALLRWKQGTTLIAPGMFLAAVENETLIIDIGNWVLEASLAAMERWQKQGLDIGVSVNIAARQLLAPDFPEHVRAALSRHPAVKPSHLELEILETTALKDLHSVTAAMEECRRLGVEFSLDDFGTGYSSLTYFRRLPANVIKIDQSFVRDMLRDPADVSIIKGILGMTEAFSRVAVAEGVEHDDHGPALLALGLDIAQGYAIARPMPENEFIEWARAFKPNPSWKR